MFAHTHDVCIYIHPYIIQGLVGYFTVNLMLKCINQEQYNILCFYLKYVYHDGITTSYKDKIKQKQ